jgi:sulfatase modifying factor 1
MAITISVPDALRQAVEGGSGGRQTVLYTSKGYPSYMTVIPAFNCQDIHATALGTGRHPAFVVNGVNKAQIFIGTYQATIVDGQAISIPGQIPARNINFDNAKAACVAAGAGFHMMSNWEWAAVALWAIKNGYGSARGNTNYGQSHSQPYETGRRQDGGAPGAAGDAVTLTGSGPASWRHDNSFAGISDLVGNVWEWNDGMKLVDGKVMMPADNNFTLAEASWPDTGTRIDSVGGIQISDTVTSRNAAIGWTGYKDATVKAAYTPPITLKQALICPYDTPANLASVLGSIYANNTVGFEGMSVRGGAWYDGANAGLAELHLSDARSTVNSSVGFRPAFIA